MSTFIKHAFGGNLVVVNFQGFFFVPFIGSVGSVMIGVHMRGPFIFVPILFLLFLVSPGAFIFMNVAHVGIISFLVNSWVPILRGSFKHPEVGALILQGLDN